MGTGSPRRLPIPCSKPGTKMKTRTHHPDFPRSCRRLMAIATDETHRTSITMMNTIQSSGRVADDGDAGEDGDDRHIDHRHKPPFRAIGPAAEAEPEARDRRVALVRHWRAAVGRGAIAHRRRGRGAGPADVKLGNVAGTLPVRKSRLPDEHVRCVRHPCKRRHQVLPADRSLLSALIREIPDVRHRPTSGSHAAGILAQRARPCSIIVTKSGRCGGIALHSVPATVGVAHRCRDGSRNTRFVHALRDHPHRPLRKHLHHHDQPAGQAQRAEPDDDPRVHRRVRPGRRG